MMGRREPPTAAREKRISHKGPATGPREERGWAVHGHRWGVTGMGHGVTTCQNWGLSLRDGQPWGGLELEDPPGQ